MNITGPCINKLSISTIQKLFKRIGEIIKSSFIEQTILGFLNEASEEQTLVDNLNVGEQNQIIELLKSFTECANLKKNAEITFETFKNYLKL